MKKSPADRYATADALSEDIERYLAGEPIAARKDGGWYHTSKFISRHRVSFVSAGMALAAVLATAAIAISEAHSAAIHARAAAAERDRALALSARNAAVGEFLHILITEAARSNKPVAAGDLVTRSEAIVNQEYRDSPEDRAAVLDVLSGYYDTKEEYPRAEELLRQALEIVKSSADFDLRRKLMCSHAATLAKVGQVPEAIRVLNSVLADPQITAQQSAGCLISLSRIAQASGDGLNALKFGQLALQRLRQDASHTPAVLAADFLADIGNSEYLNLHNDAARQLYRQSLAKLTEAGLGLALDALVLRNNESDAAISVSKNLYRTMKALLIRAEVNLNAGMGAAAEADAKRVLRLAGTAQGIAPYSNCTGLSWLMLGRVLKKRGDEVGARKAFQAAVENLSNTVDADHPKLLLARQLADAGL
jgi:hypothetical protein